MGYKRTMRWYVDEAVIEKEFRREQAETESMVGLKPVARFPVSKGRGLRGMERAVIRPASDIPRSIAPEVLAAEGVAKPAVVANDAHDS